jgi:hypothetical protein
MYYFVAVRVSVWETNERDSSIGSRRQDRSRNCNYEAISQEFRHEHSIEVGAEIFVYLEIDFVTVVRMTSKLFRVVTPFS